MLKFAVDFKATYMILNWNMTIEQYVFKVIKKLVSGDL